jgi:hypothetical protein
LERGGIGQGSQSLPSTVPSEAVVQSVIRAEFFSLVSKVPDCRTLEILLERSIRRPVHMTCWRM